MQEPLTEAEIEDLISELLEVESKVLLQFITGMQCYTHFIDLFIRLLSCVLVWSQSSWGLIC